MSEQSSKWLKHQFIFLALKCSRANQHKNAVHMVLWFSPYNLATNVVRADWQCSNIGGTAKLEMFGADLLSLCVVRSLVPHYVLKVKVV